MTAYTQNVLRNIFTLSLPSFAYIFCPYAARILYLINAIHRAIKKKDKGLQQSCKSAVLYNFAIFLQTTSNSWLCTCLFGDEGKEFCDCKQVKPGFTTYQPQLNNFRALIKLKKQQQKISKNNKTN